jgi:cellulose synthase/poly-beta-1,6-N-acetylglucosamine synthase-like glycosyltransferase
LQTHETLSPSRLGRESLLTWLCVTVTLAASALLAREVFGVLLERTQQGGVAAAFEQAVFIALVAVLLYGNLIYQATRLGYLRRRRLHRPARREELERVYENACAPPLTILVPSYREETRIVRQTLLSAALQDYPNRRVVLLIDDPPDPGDPEAHTALEAARALPREVKDLLEKPAVRFGMALEAFLARLRGEPLDLREEARTLAMLHAEAAAWLEAQAAGHPDTDHTDRFFVELVFHTPARAHWAQTHRLEHGVVTGELLDPGELLRAYQRLASLFRVEITCFERKRYVNLSHEPNKAMNLNSYIALLGRRFRAVERSEGVHLEPAAGRADLAVPGADYLVTLDADSLLAHDYALRLVYWMEQPGNERVAVAQTPYSAVPRAGRRLERVAGATTDIQYVIHQGFTRHSATYWVGANALLRRKALEDIRIVRRERGFEVPCFIQDHTVIEDTESSVDLIARGWRLHNYPERLAWSATPPDFGSLVIQRRRWANGGLLILPKLLRHLLPRIWRPRALAEAWMRCHYLVSIAGVNTALLLLLAWPFEQSLRQWWFPLAALPYFALYARDLRLCGYRASDVFRTYALNLLLLPVNLGGVAKSLHQAATGSKTPFGRTPKVTNRTPVPSLYLLLNLAIPALLLVALGFDITRGLWVHALFVLVNGGLLFYAVVRFIGLAEIAEDLRLQFREPRREARGRQCVA